MGSFDSASTSSATWHIVWQTVDGRDLLANPEMADHIRGRLLSAHRGRGRALLHFLVTPSELHLLSRLPREASPGEITRTVGNIVARWVRQANGIPGVVFSGPYRAYAIDSVEAARGEIRMLAWRPVTLGLCQVPSYYATSSLRATLGLTRTMGFDALAPLQLFAGSIPEGRKAMRALIARRPTAIELRQWELSRGMAMAPGYAGTFALASRPVQGLAAALVAASTPQGIDGALSLLERWVLLKLGHQELHDLEWATSQTGARCRALVACLAMALDLCPAASVARHYKRAKATLSERMAACRRDPEDLGILGLPRNRVVDEAIALGKGNEV